MIAGKESLITLSQHQKQSRWPKIAAVVLGVAAICGTFGVTYNNKAEIEVDQETIELGGKIEAVTKAVELGYNISKDIGKMIWEVTGSYKPYKYMLNFDLDRSGNFE